MKTPHSIIVAALIIAACILIRPAEAQRVGPFQLMHHSNPTANAGVFRLDTSTGDVSYCYITGDNFLACTKEK